MSSACRNTPRAGLWTLDSGHRLTQWLRSSSLCWSLVLCTPHSPVITATGAVLCFCNNFRQCCLIYTVRPKTHASFWVRTATVYIWWRAQRKRCVVTYVTKLSCTEAIVLLFSLTNTHHTLDLILPAQTDHSAGSCSAFVHVVPLNYYSVYFKSCITNC